MIKFFIQRPISVFVAFLSCFIIGLVTYKTLPVSLLPDIDIPEITIHVTKENTSARELENTTIKVLRDQLMQTTGLDDIYSEAKNESGIIRLRFTHGTKTDLAFIEVNEKIDMAMSRLPKSTPRPIVIKSNASDIPILYLNITLDYTKAQLCNEDIFFDLCKYTDNVIRRRIEQLPEVAMVDISGIISQQAHIIPQKEKLENFGLRVEDLEKAILDSNIDLGNMIVHDGHYQYSVKFSNFLNNIEDIKRIPLQVGSRNFTLDELSDIRIEETSDDGYTRYMGNNCLSLAIIKNEDCNLSQIKTALFKCVRELTKENPHITIHISQDQTKMLDYTLNNLKQNLLIGLLLILGTTFIFMQDTRSSIVIGICLLVSIVMSFIFFYLFNISLNIVSISGLILSQGMMIDNAIIATENISQHHIRTNNINKSCIIGIKEILSPTLSSTLTTIAVFMPLVFISGIAGSIFFDEAFSITIGLLCSYITCIILLPTLYKTLHTVSPVTWILIRPSTPRSSRLSTCINKTLLKTYNRGIILSFSHRRAIIILTTVSLPLCILLFCLLPKENMPKNRQTELLLHVDWNENINLDDNLERVKHLESICSHITEEYCSYVGKQQYLLNKKTLSETEAEIYFRAANEDSIKVLKQLLQTTFSQSFPDAKFKLNQPQRIFEQVFDTNKDYLVAELSNNNSEVINNTTEIQKAEDLIAHLGGDISSGPAKAMQINLHIDYSQLHVYGINKTEIIHCLETALHNNNISVINNSQDYLPIIIKGNDQNLETILYHSSIHVGSDEGTTYSIPLKNFITISYDEGLKKIVAGESGEYIPFTFTNTKRVNVLIENLKQAFESKLPNWKISFSGAYFSNTRIAKELTVVLLISLLLMYFILTSQFGSFLQPLIVLLEIPINFCITLILMNALGQSLNVMSFIGLIIGSGIVINDSILKLDLINSLRKKGLDLKDAIHVAGERRLRPIIMTSLTTIFAAIPLLFTNDFGSELQKPIAITLTTTTFVGTIVSLFIIPILYWYIYRNHHENKANN